MAVKLHHYILFVFISFVVSTQLHAQGARLMWVKGIGGAYADRGCDIATDRNGNVYTTGFYNGSYMLQPNSRVNFNPGSAPQDTFYMSSQNGSYDIFISRLDAKGDFVWAKSMGGNAIDQGLGITTDNNGFIYTTGAYQLQADFDPGTGSAYLNANKGSDIFISKLDSNGNYVWAKSIGGAGDDYGNGIATDGQGNVYIAGRFSGMVDFNPGMAPTDTFYLQAQGKEDIFICKLSKDGDFVWARQIGGKEDDWGFSIHVSRQGNVFVAGTFRGTVDFDPGPGTHNISSVGDFDVCVVKLDSDGRFVWANSMGGPDHDYGNSVTTDTSENVYIAGSFMETITFPPLSGIPQLVSKGWDDIFIAKLDAKGQFVWAKGYGGTEPDYAYAVTTDLQENVYATGSFQKTVDFNPAVPGNKCTAKSAMDIFIVQLNTNGALDWVKSFGSKPTVVNIGWNITVDSLKNIYTTGEFQDTVNFDTDLNTALLSGKGYSDIFIHKMSYCPLAEPNTLDVTTFCKDYTLNNNTYTQSGTYTQRLINERGCDSILILNLELVDSSFVNITINVFQLGTTLPYKSYQWFFNGKKIPGATDSTYTVTENGEYTVLVEDEYGCKVMSAVYKVTNAGHSAISNAYIRKEGILIYPNPTSDHIYIQSPIHLNIRVAGIDGKIRAQYRSVKDFPLSNLAEGMYVLYISDLDDRLIKTEKIVKQAGEQP